MHLSCIIERLNRKLRVQNEKFYGAKYYDNLAFLVNRSLPNGGTQQLPLVDETEIAIDDTYPLTIYHRVLTKPYTKNANETYTAKCQMLMVVFGVKEKLGIDAEQLESQLISLFPKQFTKEDISGLEGINGVYFELKESNLSALQVFNQEYTNSKLTIDGNTILFSTRYDAEITFKKDCLDFCPAVHLPVTLCEFIQQSSATSILDCLTEEQETAITNVLCDSQPCGDITYIFKVNGQTRSTVTLSGCEDQNINGYLS